MGNKMRHRHDDVDRSERHRKMAASARPGPPVLSTVRLPVQPTLRSPFDLKEWERQHVEAESQTLRYGRNVRANDPWHDADERLDTSYHQRTPPRW